MSAPSASKAASVAALDRHASECLVRQSPRAKNAIANSKKNGLPAISISASQGQFFAIQCQLIGAKSVLEVGTLGGYSTIWFAEAGAKVTSIDVNPKHREVAQENVKGLDSEIILGSALEVMPKLIAEGRKFDMVFIDADWPSQWKYFDLAVSLTREKGCIYVDNVVRAILEDESPAAGKETLVTKVGKDDRVKATMISTLSCHKEQNADEMLDGFLLAVVI